VEAFGNIGLSPPLHNDEMDHDGKPVGAAAEDDSDNDVDEYDDSNDMGAGAVPTD
jgi:hypothetical protein